MNSIIEQKIAVKLLIYWSMNIQKGTILDLPGINKSTYDSIIEKITFTIRELEQKENSKLGGLNKIVQIDETILNYKCKSHRGRSPLNRTDALLLSNLTKR